MSDGYTYTIAGETLGSTRQSMDIIYIPGILAFTASPVSFPQLLQEILCRKYRRACVAYVYSEMLC